MLDPLFYWMADHPWRVGIIISATILFVGQFDTIPGVIAQ